MPEIDTLALATQELPAASTALGGGDEAVTRLAVDFRALISSVTNASAKAAGEAVRLHGDDVMNPEGRSRLLAELPSSLISATADQLQQADVNLDIVEGLHLAAILRHDSRDDANLRAELHNYTVNLEQKNAAATLVELAGDARYSTYMAGPLGKSLAARFNLDGSIFRKVALESLAVNGSEDQVRRSAALAAIPAARRVIGLARGARDHAASASQRAPKREQRVNALMP
jgi:hypothetical protein